MDAEQGAPQGPVMFCWACGVLVTVPLVDGAAAPAFKCGWCAAINKYNELPQQQQQQVGWPPPPQQHQHQQHQHPPAPAPPQQQQQQHLPARSWARRARRVAWLAWGWCVVAVVLALVLSIAGVGAGLLLGLVCSSWATYCPNLALAALLTTNVICNYAASVMHSPGTPAECGLLPRRGPRGQVAAGAFERFTWCAPCGAPKPPQAHHCRVCGVCVTDMDHHCPFINSCVGRGNLRPFLLFLFWTLLSCAYVLGMCCLLLRRQWAAVAASVRAPAAAGAVPPSGWLLATTGLLAVFVQDAPGWLMAAWYLIAACTAVLLGVGVLLGSQLSYLSRGLSYVDSLKRGGGGGGEDSSEDGGEPHGAERLRLLWARLREVLCEGGQAGGGGGLVFAVLVPSWRRYRPPPEGPAEVKKWA